MAILLLMRWAGIFQGLELKMLDLVLRLRPEEPRDERILIVGINETDIQRLGTYPVPDQDMAALLQALDQYKPRAVGIDIYRDLPVEPGHEELVTTLADLPYVIGVEKVLATPVNPPPSLPSSRVGFVDFPLDEDGFVRRALLGTYDLNNEYRFSLAIMLASAYLAPENLVLENGIQDPEAMRFGKTEFPRVMPNTGGYRQEEIWGNQVLLNVRSGDNPFPIVSFYDVIEGRVPPEWIHDRVILIGHTSSSVNDVLNSAAIHSLNPGLVYGVEVHAHLVSQLLSAVLDGRPLLRTWPEWVEYSWIVLWGTLGGGLVLASRNLLVAVLGSSVLLLILIGTGIGLGIAHIWVPILVPAIAFVITSALTTSLQLFQMQQQQQMALRLLGQQTSTEIAQTLWQERQRLTASGRLPGQSLIATILFSDIRKFTALSERQTPQEVMSWLNDYFIAMTEEVHLHSGVVNKFIGDGLMAVFGVPIPHTDPQSIALDAQRAVDCALAMGQRLETLNRLWQEQGIDAIQIRIGIFTGPVMVGSLGGQQRLEYGVIGDSVNTASRLEGCEKERQTTSCRILIAQETLDYLGDQFEVESWGDLWLRGKQKSVRVYRVKGRRDALETGALAK